MLALTQRPKYVALSSSISETNDIGAAVNSTPKSQLLSWTGVDAPGQAAKRIEKSTTSVDVDIEGFCENPTADENMKLQISSSTPSKVASSFVNTVVVRNHDSQSHKPSDIKTETPSYNRLATLRAGDSRVYKNIKERRLQSNKQHKIHQIQSRFILTVKDSPSSRPIGGIRLVTSSSGRHYRPRVEKLRPQKILCEVYARPFLEYANQVVYSRLTKDVTLIEGVQRVVTKVIVGLKSVDYEMRLVVLDFLRSIADFEEM
ncbi:hypothetical protein CLF_106471 [Clonorchis sinensis]|uniref:Uncharacterized protein n=1 Tax=Clonorchis sinensis TaxID=79923 RepID=G7YF83_CLOSI|nr:hypothetical protein CLF_106471 [Clonorchis sinensis]